MACFLYEFMLLFGIALVPGAVGALMVLRYGESFGTERGLVLQTFAFFFFGAYFMWFWVRRGQTLAMQTWRIRLETATGDRLGAARAGARYLASWLWLAPPAIFGAALQMSTWQKLAVVVAWMVGYAALALLHPQRQFWHDALCGTRLVPQPRLQPPAQPVG